MPALSIRNRLILGFTLLVAIVFIGLGYALVLSRTADEETRALVDNSFRSLIAAESARASFYEASSLAGEFLVNREQAQVNVINSRLAGTAEYLQTIGEASPDLFDRVDYLMETTEDYQDAFNRMVDIQVRRGLDENSGL